MIISVAAVSAPFRGTQLVYTLGERVDTAPAGRPIFVGSILTKLAHLYSYISPISPSFLPLPDLHTEARALSYQQISFGSLLSQLRKSNWDETDTLPFDCTFQAAQARGAEGWALGKQRGIGHTQLSW
ncbi:hypothetical protein BOTBODRAFT_51124 [Botryobasidium botryosum FD-172 SS1]|uniref:Uncharacterized protein n=1 Tax=Botryobasidium botryosum (strain FD-172 SS1) TaxID=930990 RepID=A0A067MVS1_BOTB1|nr:hypothetical protein BOTBODRAFT_51124 [Botryobasidium botryosum FD-172 SS1]